jgi:hypothetical protein
LICKFNFNNPTYWQWQWQWQWPFPHIKQWVEKTKKNEMTRYDLHDIKLIIELRSSMCRRKLSTNMPAAYLATLKEGDP